MTIKNEFNEVTRKNKAILAISKIINSGAVVTPERAKEIMRKHGVSKSFFLSVVKALVKH